MNRILSCGVLLGLLCPVAQAQSTDAAAATNRFAFNLYSQVSSTHGNLFFSPFSISTALAMTQAGARGETAAEMATALGVTSGQDQIHAGYKRLLESLAAPDDDAYELSVANALWLQDDYAFLPAYLELVKANYGAELATVDYAATEAARKTINAWVERKTKDKIEELLKPGILKPDTRLVLTNAIYFKGQWLRAFPLKGTQEQPFHITAERSVDVPMMRQDGQFPYVEAEGVTGIELPYVGGTLAMVILLPAEAGGLSALEQRLTAENVETWLAAMTPTNVALSLPRFKASYEVSLKEQLRAMGMTKAFTAEADFSGLTGTKDLSISAVVHKAYADVNEEGTEAAAATGVVITKVLAPLRTPFVADHPFVYLIRHQPSGAILFMGRLSEPGE